jgi:hypothetical protein
MENLSLKEQIDTTGGTIYIPRGSHPVLAVYDAFRAGWRFGNYIGAIMYGN